MVHRRAKPASALLGEFEEHVCKGRDPRDVIARIIAPLAERYGEIIGQAYANVAGAEQVNEHLRWLGRLEFSDWVPPALAFLDGHGDDHVATQRFFAGLERLGYAMLIDRWGVYDRIERFSRVTDAIEQGTWNRPDSALALTAEEVCDVLTVLDGPVYETLSARARSTLLLRLDALLSGSGARYDHPVITVEHILPQTPAPQSLWMTWFPDEDERRAWTHRLGNLALLTRKKNSAASNHDFARKKDAYFLNGGVSPFPLTTQVVVHPEWTPLVVADRQRMLVDSFAAHRSLH